MLIHVAIDCSSLAICTLVTRSVRFEDCGDEAFHIGQFTMITMTILHGVFALSNERAPMSF